MTPELHQAFSVLNERMNDLISKVQSLSPELQRLPVGKSFSPAEMLDHMGMTEASYLPFMEAARKQPLPHAPSQPSLFFKVYKMFTKRMKSGSKVTVPAPSNLVPVDVKDVDESAAAWRDARVKVLEFLKDFDDDVQCIHHKMFGKISPRQIHDLFSTHQNYHETRLPQ